MGLVSGQSEVVAVKEMRFNGNSDGFKRALDKVKVRLDFETMVLSKTPCLALCAVRGFEYSRDGDVTTAVHAVDFCGGAYKQTRHPFTPRSLHVLLHLPGIVPSTTRYYTQMPF